MGFFSRKAIDVLEKEAAQAAEDPMQQLFIWFDDRQKAVAAAGGDAQEAADGLQDAGARFLANRLGISDPDAQTWDDQNGRFSWQEAPE